MGDKTLMQRLFVRRFLDVNQVVIFAKLGIHCATSSESRLLNSIHFRSKNVSICKRFRLSLGLKRDTGGALRMWLIAFRRTLLKTEHVCVHLRLPGVRQTRGEWSFQSKHHIHNDSHTLYCMIWVFFVAFFYLRGNFLSVETNFYKIRSFISRLLRKITRTN